MTLRAYGSLFGTRHGEGPLAILALHGWGRTRTDYDALLSGYDALALDLPGFGATPPPQAPTGAAGYAELIGPILEQFDSPPVLLGHSFGGRVAVALAADRSTEVAGLVLVGVPLLRISSPGRRPALGYRLIRWAHRRGFLSDDRVESARHRYGSEDYRAASGVMRDVLVRAVNESYESELSRIECPVSLVWGGEDRAVPTEVARQAAAILTDVELDVVDGGGHDVHLSHPARVRAALDRRLP